MRVVHADSTFTIDPTTGSPDYDRGNSLLTLVENVALLRQNFFAEQSSYAGESLQFLFPFEKLELYGPAGAEWQLTDPTQQDNKNDFQKQNVRTFDLADTLLVRGWARSGDDLVPFLRISYRAGPDSNLAKAVGGNLGDDIRLWASVGANATPQLITVPYDAASATYAVELWGAVDSLDAAGEAARNRGALIPQPQLMWGNASQFEREQLSNTDMRSYLGAHPMHPVNALPVHLAWADASQTVWDSNSGQNHRYEFSMKIRGWDHFLQAGISPNPHGGVGFLEFRNLFSNYFGFSRDASKLPPEMPTELGRRVESFQIDAHGHKGIGNPIEDFFAVDYMDLHSVNVDAGIGLHRHRDNSEVFLMMEGQALMVVGDWLEMDQRARAFEVRTLSAGQLAMLKGGQLHGLLNLTDRPCRLFMFGGYD